MLFLGGGTFFPPPFEIIQKHPELTYAVQKLDFDNRYEAISWICKHQLGRRNLTPQQKKYLIVPTALPLQRRLPLSPWA